METKQDVYKREDMAKKIGISYRTLLRWEKKGLLKPKQHPISNAKYYTQADYDYYMEQLEKGFPDFE